MGCISVYLKEEEEQAFKAEAARRRIRPVDLMRERMDTAKLLEQLTQDLALVKETLERLEHQAISQTHFNERFLGAVLGRTTFMMELFVLMNEQTQMQSRTTEAMERTKQILGAFCEDTQRQ